MLTLLAGALAPCHSASARGERLQQGIQALVAQKYDVADAIFAALQAADPNDFDALYFRFTTRQTRILDYESYALDGDLFLEYADSIIVSLVNRLSELKGADSVRCLFYLGNAYGGKSAMQAKNDKWLGAISTAFNTTSYLKVVVRKDPSFLPAYFGIGVYNYYLSKNLKWLPMFGDRRSEGIKDIMRATCAQLPYNLGAKNILCWILIEQGEYRRADSLANTVLATMPENTIFLRIRTVIAVYTGSWERAGDLSRRLAGISRQRTPVNWSDLTCGYDVLVKSYEKMGKIPELLRVADTALAVKVPLASRRIPYVEMHLKSIGDIRARNVRPAN